MYSRDPLTKCLAAVAAGRAASWNRYMIMTVRPDMDDAYVRREIFGAFDGYVSVCTTNKLWATRDETRSGLNNDYKQLSLMYNINSSTQCLSLPIAPPPPTKVVRLNFCYPSRRRRWKAESWTESRAWLHSTCSNLVRYCSSAVILRRRRCCWAVAVWASVRDCAISARTQLNGPPRARTTPPDQYENNRSTTTWSARGMPSAVDRRESHRSSAQDSNRSPRGPARVPIRIFLPGLQVPAVNVGLALRVFRSVAVCTVWTMYRNTRFFRNLIGRSITALLVTPPHCSDPTNRCSQGLEE